MIKISALKMSLESYLKVSEENYVLLKWDTIKEYISELTSKFGFNTIDIDKLTEFVFPKLMKINSIDDIENRVISAASEMNLYSPEYEKLAVRLTIEKIHSETSNDIVDVARDLYYNTYDGFHAPIVPKSYFEFVRFYQTDLNSMLFYQRDFDNNFFGLKTLEKNYLKKTSDGKLVERPQHFWLRIAIGIHYNDVFDFTNPARNQEGFDKDILDLIKKTYDMMSLKYFTHATPTLFNASTISPQMSSCYLLGTGDDITTLGNTDTDCMIISKYAGGIGLSCTPIRSRGSIIKSSLGKSNGMEYVHKLNATARYVTQGGRRPGAIACYLEPWHDDIEYFLLLKRKEGSEEHRARNLFYGLMINDIFMRRVRDNEIWSLMSPDVCPNLLNKYGKEFDKAYLEYESKGKFVRQVKARDLWLMILDSQLETGTPYMIYKDASNERSNHKNIGTINCSNLCTEILEYSDKDEYAVCNLASICLPKFVKTDEKGELYFDHYELCELAKIIITNLNKIIDHNFYPVKQAKKSNMRHRPTGVGVQGLADVFAMFHTPFDSELARKLNREIFETIYYGALSQSVELARKYGKYETFDGSPYSQGIFQFEMNPDKKTRLSGRWDFETLRKTMMFYGLRNSLLVALMPTASTSQIMGNNEGIEPYTSNVYIRSTIAGKHYVINSYLVRDLKKMGLWNSDIIDQIKFHEGSIQSIEGIPDDIKLIYRTCWEIPQKSLVEMSADRQDFVDQSQSFNVYLDKPSYEKLTSIHFGGWNAGLKTGMYYCHVKPANQADKFGIDVHKDMEFKRKLKELKCSNEEGCVMCQA